MSSFFSICLLGFFVSLGVGVLILKTSTFHRNWTEDHFKGAQKFHVHPTPRIGGLGIWLGLWVITLTAPSALQDLLWVLSWASIPAFAMGFVEDLTRQVSTTLRLMATIASGLLACGLSGSHLDHVDLPWLDLALALPWVGTAFTAFAIGGVVNAINIIDGFNGLAAGVVLIGLLAMGFVAQSVGDLALMQLCWLLCALILGFGVLNFPLGKIFMGDGGAYFLGFGLAWVAVLLPMRNPQVSPWCSLLACLYPVLEVMFSISRRLTRNMHPGHPDRLHLHSLIKVRIVRKHLAHLPPVWMNSAVSPLVWAFAAVPATLAVWLSEQTYGLMLAVGLSALAYQLTYRRLIRFAKAPST